MGAGDAGPEAGAGPEDPEALRHVPGGRPLVAACPAGDPVEDGAPFRQGPGRKVRQEGPGPPAAVGIDGAGDQGREVRVVVAADRDGLMPGQGPADGRGPSGEDEACHGQVPGVPGTDHGLRGGYPEDLRLEGGKEDPQLMVGKEPVPAQEVLLLPGPAGHFHVQEDLPGDGGGDLVLLLRVVQVDPVAPGAPALLEDGPADGEEAPPVLLPQAAAGDQGELRGAQRQDTGQVPPEPDGEEADLLTAFGLLPEGVEALPETEEGLEGGQVPGPPGALPGRDEEVIEALRCGVPLRGRRQELREEQGAQGEGPLLQVLQGAGGQVHDGRRPLPEGEEGKAPHGEDEKDLHVCHEGLPADPHPGAAPGLPCFFPREEADGAGMDLVRQLPDAVVEGGVQDDACVPGLFKEAAGLRRLPVSDCRQFHRPGEAVHGFCLYKGTHRSFLS